ncbi:c-type cytochrome [Piscinibacter sakaiensis]|uniref:c-type cytochrome n=1 Tax=Piscinibacter sakaiensis TaxID=1547922 RepID=UPI003AABDDD8
MAEPALPTLLRRLLAAAAGLLCLQFAPAASAAPFEDSMAQRVLACTGCHGAQGRSAPDGYYPRIAGKPAGYLLQQLQHFRDGRRRYQPMQRLLGNLDDHYLAQIAEHFAALDLPYPGLVVAHDTPPQQLAAGRQLVEDGDAARQIPACTACHGEQLGGVAPAIPGLLGLPVDYLNGQLGAWRSGSRRAAEPDCMAAITRRLTAADIAAVSRWLAAQPVPARYKPLASADGLPTGLPIDCGSTAAQLPDGVRQ